MVSACGKRSKSPGVSMPLTSPCDRAWSMAADSACANSAFNSMRGTDACRVCSDTAISTRPRPRRFCTKARSAGSSEASGVGNRNWRSRKR